MRPDSPYTLELLEDYVNGLLSSEGNARVERLIAQHEEVAMIIQGIESLKKSKGSTDSLHAFDAAEMPSSTEPKVRSLWPRLFLVAASLAVLVVAGYFLMQHPSLEEVLAQEVSEPYSMGLVVRGDQGQEMAQAFEAGDFERVVALGSAVPASEMSAEVKVQLGIASLKTGRSEACITYLDTSIDSNPLLGLTNKWYRALALTSLQDDAAIPLLNDIKASGGLHASAAADVLDAIDREWK